MTNELFTLHNELNYLNLRISLLKESKDEYISIRDDYIQKNKINERKLRRLVNLKEQYEYLKDVLLQDNCKYEISVDQRIILLNHRIKEFQKKNEQMKNKLENLPLYLQLQEIIGINKKLTSDYLKWHKMFEKLRKDYRETVCTVESDFIQKVTEFSKEYLELKKLSRENENNIVPTH